MQRPQGLWMLKALVKRLYLLQVVNYSGLHVSHAVVLNDFSASAIVANQ